MIIIKRVGNEFLFVIRKGRKGENNYWWVRVYIYVCIGYQYEFRFIFSSGLASFHDRATYIPKSNQWVVILHLPTCIYKVNLLYIIKVVAIRLSLSLNWNFNFMNEVRFDSLQFKSRVLLHPILLNCGDASPLDGKLELGVFK